ncbi:hypothetical protein HYH03_011350 [Edaphochlamys debaryana]|uniref:Guanylate cyclase domain-containing protein n=1 Tax=Edaphochlamys debaryana TaxID=47281 RepID=A0A836BV99_9CHLO|nr:hypothetical protein HYH03_011350 [Edaphochlamys debaryana]|eukprot:KAG2490225.1 hypothetical protein HYH03_011350 [Edaphochlamys debaryana]
MGKSWQLALAVLTTIPASAASQEGAVDLSTCVSLRLPDNGCQWQSSFSGETGTANASRAQAAWAQLIQATALCVSGVDLTGPDPPPAASGTYLALASLPHFRRLLVDFEQSYGLRYNFTEVSQERYGSLRYRIADALPTAADPGPDDFWLVSAEVFGMPEAVSSFLDTTLLLFSDPAYGAADIPSDWRAAMSSASTGSYCSIPATVLPTHMYYRTEIFAVHNISVPATWDELLAVAEAFHGRDMDGDGLPEYGICMDTREACGQYGDILLMVLATMVQTRGPTDGVVFDPSDLSLLATGEALAEAIRIYRGLIRFGLPPDMPCRSFYTQLLPQGRCIMALGWPLAFKVASHASVPSKVSGGKLGTAPLPGSERVLDRPSGRLVPCTRELCPYAQRVARGVGSSAQEALVNSVAVLESLAFAINRHAPLYRQAAAFRMLATLMAPAQQQERILALTEGGPTRASQLELRDWVAAGYDPDNARSFLGTYGAMLESPNVFFELRFPGVLRYTDALAELIKSVLWGDVSLAAAEVAYVASAAAVVEQQGGAAALLPVYRRSLGIVETRRRGESSEGQKGAAPAPKKKSKALVPLVIASVGAAGILAFLAVFGLLRRRWMAPRPAAQKYRPLDAPGPGVAVLCVTDIENSTCLWETLTADVCQAAVSLHHAAIRTAAQQHRGYESATEGDSFILAFRSSLDCLRFCLRVQEALLALDWPPELLDSPYAATLAARHDPAGMQPWVRRAVGLSLRPLLRPPTKHAATGHSSEERRLSQQWPKPSTSRHASLGAAPSRPLSSSIGSGGGGLVPGQQTLQLPSQRPPHRAQHFATFSGYSGPAGLITTSSATQIADMLDELSKPAVQARDAAASVLDSRLYQSNPAALFAWGAVTPAQSQHMGPPSTCDSRPAQPPSQSPAFLEPINPPPRMSADAFAALPISGDGGVARAESAPRLAIAIADAINLTPPPLAAHHLLSTEPALPPCRLAAAPELRFNSAAQGVPDHATSPWAKGFKSMAAMLSSALSSGPSGDVPGFAPDRHALAAAHEPKQPWSGHAGRPPRVAAAAAPGARPESVPAANRGPPQALKAAVSQLMWTWSPGPGRSTRPPDGPAEADLDPEDDVSGAEAHDMWLEPSALSFGPLAAPGLRLPAAAAEASIGAVCPGMASEGGRAVLETVDVQALLKSCWVEAPLAAAAEALPTPCDTHLVFRGLRVRMGFHRGVLGPCDVNTNQASQRVMYSGPVLQLARAIGDVGRGGQVLMSTAALASLNPQQLASEAAVVLHSGRHVIKPSDASSVELYSVFGQGLLPRAVFMEPPRSHIAMAPGVLEAPLGRLAVAVAQVEELGGLGPQGVMGLYGTLRAQAQDLAASLKGYLLLTGPGALQAVFHDPAAAARWCLLFHETVLDLSQSPDAMFQSRVQLGMDLGVRSGVDVGTLEGGLTFDGRLSYEGSACKVAKCLAANAAWGEVLASFAVVTAVLGEGHPQLASLQEAAAQPAAPGVAGPSGEHREAFTSGLLPAVSEADVCTPRFSRPQPQLTQTFFASRQSLQLDLAEPCMSPLAMPRATAARGEPPRQQAPAALAAAAQLLLSPFLTTPAGHACEGAACGAAASPERAHESASSRQMLTTLPTPLGSSWNYEGGTAVSRRFLDQRGSMDTALAPPKLPSLPPRLPSIPLSPPRIGSSTSGKQAAQAVAASAKRLREALKPRSHAALLGADDTDAGSPGLVGGGGSGGPQDSTEVSRNASRGSGSTRGGTSRIRLFVSGSLSPAAGGAAAPAAQGPGTASSQHSHLQRTAEVVMLEKRASRCGALADSGYSRAASFTAASRPRPALAMAPKRTFSSSRLNRRVDLALPAQQLEAPPPPRLEQPSVLPGPEQPSALLGPEQPSAMPGQASPAALSPFAVRSGGLQGGGCGALAQELSSGSATGAAAASVALTCRTTRGCPVVSARLQAAGSGAEDVAVPVSKRLARVRRPHAAFDR